MGHIDVFEERIINHETKPSYFKFGTPTTSRILEQIMFTKSNINLNEKIFKNNDTYFCLFAVIFICFAGLIFILLTVYLICKIFKNDKRKKTDYYTIDKTQLDKNEKAESLKRDAHYN